MIHENIIAICEMLSKHNITLSDTPNSISAFIDNNSENFYLPITSVTFKDKSVNEVVQEVLFSRTKHLEVIQRKKDDSADEAFLSKLFKKEADCYGTSFNKDGRAMYEETFIRIVKGFLRNGK